MPTPDAPGAPRLSRFETLGAWLGIWTPPRGAAVPPVPWRRLAVGAAVAVVVLAGLAAWLVPRIDRAKRRKTAQERRAAAALDARELRRLRADQRLHAGRLGRVPAGAAARAAILAALERAITADARARSTAGTLAGRVESTTCAPYSRDPSPAAVAAAATAGRYECTAITRDIPRSSRNLPGAIGYPFWARVDFRRGTFAWCKVNLRPGERGIGGEAAVAALPAGCDLQRP